MKRNWHYPIYVVIKFFVRLFSPKMKVEGLENLPQDPCLIVANHTQMYGPISCQLYFPGKRAIWCAHQMMELKEVPGYAFQDFWSQKPRWIQPFFKLASYLIAPISVCVFNNASTIPVYRDHRLVTTFRDSVEALKAGANVVIFPEQDVRHNNIVYDFQTGFVDVARSYHRQTGKQLCFVPMYIAPDLGKMVLGKPLPFDPQAPVKSERRRICDAMMADITALAAALPLHTVVPYRNIPKKLYPKNIPVEVAPHEETRC